ncbi:pleckstrin homology domain-containing family G member 7-like isoform X1 [Mytilus trossulus]|uniref:pleckstrin homology domain-containing family G member 7-like isoform X1 n=2 Tax=Mytilus trossulus TaxID=6551 RepID=UPI003005B9F4
MSIRRRPCLRGERWTLQRGNTIEELALESSVDIEDTICKERRPLVRRASSSLSSLTSEHSEESAAPPIPRRGRRLAIVDTKNVGDVSPTPMSSDATPNTSCDEDENRRNRRKSSDDLENHNYQREQMLRDKRKKLLKRNTISDFYRSREQSQPGQFDDTKKNRQSFSFRKFMKTRSKESLTKLGDVLSKLKPSHFQDAELAAYKSVHWSDLIAQTENNTKPIQITETERKRREAIWELFTCECNFLIDHLMVLKHCFMEPLKNVQVEGHLMYAEPDEIFGNLDELCYISYTFCKDLIAVLLRNLTTDTIWNTSSLVEALERFAQISNEGGVFHTNCVNFSKTANALEKLRKNDDFCEFEKWCEQDPRCNRLKLNDLLVAPLQHTTKLPLLLAPIRKYTTEESDRNLLTEAIGKLEESLHQLDEKVRLERNNQRIQEIQEHLIWPSITDIDQKAYIPEFLKQCLTGQPSANLLSAPNRQLVHEGPLLLIQSTKTVEVQLFLFDDNLIITKTKSRPTRKKLSNADDYQTDHAFYEVYQQPIALDRFSMHDVGSTEAAVSGLKCIFVLVHISRFQQIIGVYTLQASCDNNKEKWIEKIMDAKDKFNCKHCMIFHKYSGKEKSPKIPSMETQLSDDSEVSPRTQRRERMVKTHHKKSLSMDTVYI